MRRKARSPFPQRDGLDAARMRTPDAGAWATMREHLVERLPIPADEVDRMLREQRVAGPDGFVDAGTPFAPRTSLWIQREPAPEVPVPFEIGVLHRDADIVVADKPHFLATTPRGGHITETALVRLRRELGLPELSPAHRLDRMTAGLVLFTARPEARRDYQLLFQNRLVRKEYLAVARHDPELELPRTVRSRIVKERGVLQAREEPGPPNAETFVELAAHRGGLGLYRLTPATGQTHQLRVHLAGLGVPIVGDELYPRVRLSPQARLSPGARVSPGAQERGDAGFSDPLQLLAAVLEFRDPRTGALRRFESRRALEKWTAAT